MKRKPKIHVLLVEDDATQAALTRALLRQQFDGALTLWETTHVEVAVTQLQDPKVEVVLLDLDLPDSRGMATVDRVIKAAPAVPIVVLTGHDDHRMRQAALDRGAQAYLVKGLANGPLLEEAVANAIRQRRPAPPASADAAGELNLAGPGHDDVPRGAGQQVLFVNGQPTLRSTMTQIFRAHGYRVHATADGNDALEHFISSPDAVQVVVTDLFLPTQGGSTLCRAVRRLKPALPIIVVTGGVQESGTDEQRQMLAELGITHILRKPHTTDALLRVLHQVLSPVPEP